MANFNTFFQNDIYTSSGSVHLMKCWTEDVFKFNTSSFYNWENDNLPIYDLEERTYLNWEKFGFPSSSIPGLALVVSGGENKDHTVTGCNKSVFHDLSSCLEALPKFINFPVLVEVCNYGDMGEFVLNDIGFGPSGSLEIINRLEFDGPAFTLSGAPGGGFVSRTGDTQAISNTGSQYGKYGLQFSSAVTNGVAGALEESIGWQIVNGSSLILSSTIASSFTDARFRGNANHFIAKYKALGLDNRMAAHLDAPGFDNALGAIGGALYEDSGSETFDGNDASCTNRITSEELLKAVPSILDLLTIRTYGNKLTKLRVRNCNGPIYIRGFLVNGNRAVQDGVVIDNSTVVLENCASVLNNGNGFLFNNSKVVLTRGCIAYRNYLQNGTARLDGNWINKSQKFSEFLDETAGLKAYNSEINVSSTSSFEFVTVRNSASGTYPANYMFEFSRNTNGIILENSVLDGGQSRSTNMASAGPITIDEITQTFLNSELNTNNGIWAKNSTLDFKGKLICFANLRGLRTEDSDITLDEYEFTAHQLEAVVAKNSLIRYGRHATAYTAAAESTYQQYEFSANGIHISLDNSEYVPVYTSSMGSKFGRHLFRMPHAITASSWDNHSTELPAIVVDNGSKLELIHSRMSRDSTERITTNTPLFGSIASVTNNSKLFLRGTGIQATRVYGSTTYAHQIRTAGLFASKNSLIELTGPTVISQFGVDALAEDNSEININPPREKESGALNISAFDLNNDANHTHVELHSTRSCLVANRNSIINLQNLGDFQPCWNRGTFGLSALASGTDYNTSSNATYASAVSGGSLQFYPNPNDSSLYVDPDGGIAAVQSMAATSFTQSTDSPDSAYYQYLAGTALGAWDNGSEGAGGLSAITAGGICVRALGNSIVNANNVIFPAGWWVPSATHYDASHTGNDWLCYRPFIWNIADSSKLYASYLSVSAQHPEDSIYVGPSACWNEGGLTAYRAPSGTPDTSGLSILDYFGISPQTTGTLDVVIPRPSDSALAEAFGGGLTSQNKGPFRIYLSPDPVTNFLTTPSGNEIFGLPYQLYAQGYQASAHLGCSSFDISSTYGKASFWASDGTKLTTSGFYYASAMLDGGVQLFLDESAANAFTNAKHLATGKSGLAKKAIIYGANESKEGDSGSATNKSLGRGIRSLNVFDLEKQN